MTMTNRERILAILDRKSPDRIPWIPRLQLWYNARQAEGTMPERFRGMTQREIEHTLRLGTPARTGNVFKVRYEGVEVRTHVEDLEETTEYVTPCGTVSKKVFLDEELSGYADSGLDLERPIKTERDYDVWEYIVEHTFYDPIYEDYLAYDASIGEDGLPLVSVGDCPFHHFLLRLVGYDQAYYELSDRLERVERLMRVMTDCDRERLWPVVANSPARLILHGVHFDSQMTPSHLFKKYITPYYQEFSKVLHARGKSLSFHGDDDSRLILQDAKDAGFDMSECFTTAPMVSCTLAEARAVWGNDVIIWGGVPSVILEDTTPEEEFEEYMRDVFRTIAPGDAFILGIADNAMPLSRIERIERISEMVEEFGNYPIRVPETAGAR
jgi:Uroporphyrinogen decarboxylase (URO-D)